MATRTGLYRSERRKVIAGVAAGMADRFGLPVWVVRLIWILLFLPGGLPGLIPYAILWLLVPSNPDA